MKHPYIAFTIAAAVALALITLTAFGADPSTLVLATGAAAVPIDELAAEMKRIMGEVKKSSDGLDARLAAVEQLAAQSAKAGRGMAGKAGNPLALHMDAIAEAAEVVISRKARSATAIIGASLPALTQKSVIVNEGFGGSSDANGYPTSHFRSPELYGHATTAPRLLSVLPTLRMDTGVLEYVELSDAYTNAADEVAEGALKPEASISMVKRTAECGTIAHWVRVSEQAAADTPQLLNQVGMLLTYGVAARGEHLIVNGSSLDGNTIVGLNEKASVFTPTAAAAADRIGEAAAELEAVGFMPGLAILHPLDWQSIRSERATGDGQYVAAGWAQPAMPSIWGLPLVTSAACPRGAAFVLDPAHVMLLARQSTTLEIFRDLPTQNLLTIRAEARLGIAILSPAAVLSLTLSDASSSSSE